MLRGAVEETGADYLAGWMYSDEAEISGKTVLAFHESECIGSGQINVQRQDLKDAGLGHGRYGFRVSVPEGLINNPVYLKLENSDAVFLPSDVKLIKESQGGSKIKAEEASQLIERFRWICTRNWIDYNFLDFVKLFIRTGYYETTVSRPISEEASHTLSKFLLNKVSVEKAAFNSAERFLEYKERLVGPIGISCERDILVEIAEGSHIVERDGHSSYSQKVRLSKGMILWIHPGIDLEITSADAPIVAYAYTGSDAASPNY